MPAEPTVTSQPESIGTLKRRFSLHGDAWTRLLTWGVRNVPPPLEPPLLVFWSTVFFLLAGRQRRAMVANLRTLFPRDSWLRAQGRAWRIFWSFANTEVEAVHCLDLGAKFDWEVEGREHFDQLANAEDGAIILTAHMSNYDVAAFLFANRLRKPLHTVRAPESTPELQALKEAERQRLFAGHVKIHYNKQADDALGLELLRALQAGDVVAIQGDRLVGEAATATADFGGLPVMLPNGPFALASIAKCRVFPLFIVRMGRRRYRIICQPPLMITRDRQPGPGRHGFSSAMDAWGGLLAQVARKYWFQWYVFEPLFPPGAKWPGDPQASKIEKLPRDSAEFAPSRCGTASMKFGGFLSLWFWKKVGNRSRIAAPECFLASSPDLYGAEIVLYSIVVPASVAGLFAGWLDHAGWAGGWLVLGWIMLAPIWLPLLLMALLAAVYVLLVPLCMLLRPGPILRHRLHWWGLWSVLAGVSFLTIYSSFLEILRLGPDKNISWSMGSALLAAFLVCSVLSQNIVAALLLPLFRRQISKLEATLPLNKLPEQLGKDCEKE